MKATNMKPIKTRTASREESIALANDTIPVTDRRDISLPDGNPDAIRVIVNAATGSAILNRDGSIRYTAPWLLCSVFA